MSELLTNRPDVSVYHATWQELAVAIGDVDALIVDAPYSEQTHKGHDDGASTANAKQQADWARRAHASGKKSKRGNKIQEVRWAARGGKRQPIGYPPWTPRDVREFVSVWGPKTRGWIVSLTDHILAPHWTHAMKRLGRLVFSPIACVEIGSRVRMVGDGPAQWSCFAIVSRPKGEPYSKWGSLCGAYVVPPGFMPRFTGQAKEVIGGKPQWLMDRLVEDYSRPGDLVCDPCAGAGTTLVAAIRTGRRAVGADRLLDHSRLAAKNVRVAQPPLLSTEVSLAQSDLFAEVS